MLNHLRRYHVVARSARAMGAVLITLGVGRGPAVLASPGPRAQATQPLAVIVGALPIAHAAGSPRYVVALVNGTGRVVARVTASVPPMLSVASPGGVSGALATPLPPVTISGSRVYYLDDGAALVRSLTPSGTVAAVTHVPGGTTAHVAIAVTPDDRRIAIGVVSYSVFTRNGTPTGNDMIPATTRIYVQDLRGGGSAPIFSLASRTVAEWPVGWVNGRVVVAVSAPGTQHGSSNPYNAFYGYHVASATTGQRLATLCASNPTTRAAPSAVGPLVPGGTLCLRADRWYLDTWDGSGRLLPGFAPTPYSAAALAPDGHTLAWDSAGRVIIQRGGGQPTTTGVAGTPLGWIDVSHLVVAMGGPSGDIAAVLDTRAGTLRRTGVTATTLTMFGLLPNAL